MEWIILCLLNGVIFFLLVDYKELKVNALSGLFTVILAIVTDYYHGGIHGRYEIYYGQFYILESSIFFLLGPCFVIGTLMAQYYPKKRWLAVMNIIVITTLYSLTEYVMVTIGAVRYKDWYFTDSLIVNIGAITIISWFCAVMLNKWRKIE